ncbi:MAG: phage portal protein [Betaproteobacteria bacterium]|nr:phage portal protein [Betaproteobacteria bacterium]
MNWLQKLFGGGEKKSFTFGNASPFITGQDLGSMDWSDTAGARGPIYNNSAVMANLGWLMDTVPEPPLRVIREAGDHDEIIPAHRFLDLLATPNEDYGYTWDDILAGVAVSLGLSGNAYIRMRFSSLYQVDSLEYIPHTLCEPVKSETGKLAGYTDKRSGKYEPVPKEQIIHFRVGIDPANQLMGLSRFATVVKSVATDNEAEVYNHSILKNLGIIGMIASPTPGKDGDAAQISPETAKAIEDRIAGFSTGRGRGRTLVLSDPLTITNPSVSPEKVHVREMRMTPEERICAIFRIPPVVIGLGAGLDKSTYNNLRESQRMAIDNCNSPMWSRIQKMLTARLLPLCGGKKGERVEFNMSAVKYLQEDENAMHDRARKNFKDGVWTRAEARIATGKNAATEDEIYFTDIENQRALAAISAPINVKSMDRAELFRMLDEDADFN